MDSKNCRWGTAGTWFVSVKRASVLLVVALAGCASNSGVVTMGPDTYFVSRQAASAFTGLGTLQADAMVEANSFCAKRGGAIEIVNVTQSKPPYLVGNFPRVDMQFRCVAQGTAP